MNNTTLTKNQGVALAVWGCVAISTGSNQSGYLADVLLIFGGAMVCAALIVPTPKEPRDE
jgi:hypothetical protein